MTSPEFTVPRVVAVYDTLNPYAPGTQPDFYLRVAHECGARSIVEVGCGTGMVALRFARHGYAVTGLDPSGLMLAVARTRPGADRVRWIEGDVGALDVSGADLAFMAGHVAQFFVADDDWREALHVLHGALRPGGRLAFESRNPAARGWESWGERVRVVDAVEGPVERWSDSVAVDGGVVSGRMHVRFSDDGAEFTGVGALRFRSADELHASLDAAGFRVAEEYGDWDRSPRDERSPEIILVAERG